MNVKYQPDEQMTAAVLLKMLDVTYARVLEGIPKMSPPVTEFAAEYRKKESSAAAAARRMIKNQTAKCAASGVVTGFGGIITMPAAIPANIGSVLYIQLRMIACTAHLAGLDVQSEQVQTLAYACLAGVPVKELEGTADFGYGQTLSSSLVTRVPTDVLARVNKKVGIRLLTKLGEKGLVSLGKLVPGLGAAVNGTLDLTETKLMGERAFRMFFLSDFSTDAGMISIDYIDE